MASALANSTPSQVYACAVQSTEKSNLLNDTVWGRNKAVSNQQVLLIRDRRLTTPGPFTGEAILDFARSLKDYREGAAH